MKMQMEESASRYWNDWRAILIDIFSCRISAIFPKGRQMTSTRKTFSAIFLQAKGFELSGVRILPEVIKRIIHEEKIDAGYDVLAMLGHRYGIIENMTGLRQYFIEVQKMLKPKGEVLLTSINTGTTTERNNLISENSTQFGNIKHIQFQQENFIGPFFKTSCFKIETLRTQLLETDWQCQDIYFQDEYNYLVRLKLKN